MKKSLEQVRQELGKKDLEILSLLNERAGLSQEVGRIKRREGIEVYDPSQETRVYSRLKESNGGPLPDSAVSRIFREILSSSRALQSQTKAAYLGPEASFTHQATLAHFGSDVILSPSRTIPEVFEAVERGEASWGVVPVENLLEGSVRETLDRLTTTSLAIRAEVVLPIALCLLSTETGRDRIRRVYSHPHAFAQCRVWLGKHLPGCRMEPAESTAAAARKAKEEPESAAVAGPIAAEHYDIGVLAQGIEDHPENRTRFLVLGRGESGATGKDKTSFIFATAHVPGALVRALTPLAEGKVNIMSIESRPVQNREWEYLFFVDIEGHRREKRVAECIREMEGRTAFLKLLGSYPRGETP
jgi:chorismate mutase / prephenate dehydratase